MFHAMFHLPVPVLEKVLRAAVIYGFLVVALRLGGRRELAQLSMFDFVLLLSVANAVQNGIIGDDNSVTGGIIGATTLFAVNGFLAYLLFRSRMARRVLEGSTIVLIRDGQVDRHALRRERLAEDDLLTQVQAVGAHSFAEVEIAALSSSGKMVVNLRQPDPATQERALISAQIAELRALVEARLPPP